MKIIVLVSLLIVLLFPIQIKIYLTFLASFIFFIYTIYFIYKLYNFKDKKIITNNFIEYPPNNNYSPYIRYLYKGKVDYKIIVLTVFELLIKGSISLKIENNIYYLIDNKVKNEDLKKSEVYVKKLLFKDIGEGHYVILNNMIKKCNSNSGYIYSSLEEFKNVFEYEVAFNKYFKSNKNLVDKSSAYLIMSFILSLYNIFFTKKIVIALLIFIVGAVICKYINDLKNKEDDAFIEYKKWIEFRNYINKNDNNLYELDDISLEQYLLYAYSMDCYYEFKNVIDKKYKDNNIDNSLLLNIVKSNIFNNIDYIFYKSINKLEVNTLFLFAKNKGRR